MLCYRCEYRAKYLEKETIKKDSGNAPRYECKQDWAVNSCYMFCPVKPIIIEPSDYEKRLQEKTGIDRGLGSLMGGRMIKSEHQPEFETVATMLKDGRYFIENKLKGKLK